MTYFVNISNLDELRKAYRRLSMIHHPDKGGDPEVMKAINNEYDALFKCLKAEHNAKAAADETGKTRPINETPEQFREIIEKLIHIPGIIIELCGSWIWISGETRAYKEQIKAAGCYWAKNKKMWYWRAPEDACRGNRKAQNMEHIRQRYGSERFTSDGHRADLIHA